MEIAYLEERLQSSLAMAKRAAGRCARLAHRQMAAQYLSRLNSTRALNSSGNMSCRHRLELEQALDRWINEGGANPE
jgi:hypothetical protein